MAQILKEEVKKRIYQAALKEFKEYGYEKGCMRRIAKNAQMTVGNLYRYFLNKEMLFYHVISPAYNKVVELVLTEDRSELMHSDFSYIEEMTTEIMRIENMHRDEFLILLHGSKQSKYEHWKEELTALLQKKIEALSKDSKNSLVDTIFAKALASSILEGAIVLISEYKDQALLIQQMKQFIKFFYYDLKESFKG